LSEPSQQLLKREALCGGVSQFPGLVPVLNFLWGGSVMSFHLACDATGKRLRLPALDKTVSQRPPFIEDSHY
jgi:hypothetical protein